MINFKAVSLPFGSVKVSFEISLGSGVLKGWVVERTPSLAYEALTQNLITSFQACRLVGGKEEDIEILRTAYTEALGLASVARLKESGVA
jgi:hypothetical protein